MIKQDDKIQNLESRVRKIEIFLSAFRAYSQVTGADDLLQQANEIVVKHDKVSASLLQRRLVIGYARAARILDQLEELGVVGPGEGSQLRKVIRK
jgi:DNA segregation ATPase FtsK/SpoIIIE, S-DNA-T family